MSKHCLNLKRKAENAIFEVYEVIVTSYDITDPFKYGRLAN